MIKTIDTFLARMESMDAFKVEHHIPEKAINQIMYKAHVQDMHGLNRTAIRWDTVGSKSAKSQWKYLKLMETIEYDEYD